MPDRALIAFGDGPASDYIAVVIEHFHPTGRGVSMLNRVADLHENDVTKLRDEVLGHGRQLITGATTSALLLQVSDADWIVTWDGDVCRVWVSSPLRHGLALWAQARAGGHLWVQTNEKPPTR